MNLLVYQVRKYSYYEVRGINTCTSSEVASISRSQTQIKLDLALWPTVWRTELVCPQCEWYSTCSNRRPEGPAVTEPSAIQESSSRFTCQVPTTTRKRRPPRRSPPPRHSRNVALVLHHSLLARART